jgi:hypothetical protein
MAVHGVLAARDSQDLSGCKATLDEAAERDAEGEQAKPVVSAPAVIEAWKRTTDPGGRLHRELRPAP